MTCPLVHLLAHGSTWLPLLTGPTQSFTSMALSWGNSLDPKGIILEILAVTVATIKDLPSIWMILGFTGLCFQQARHPPFIIMEMVI